MVEMIVGAVIAIVCFIGGYKFNDVIQIEDDIGVIIPDPREAKADDAMEKVDTSDIFRIKSGPKKGLLSYKKVK